jgi:hypothetical protein
VVLFNIESIVVTLGSPSLGQEAMREHFTKPFLAPPREGCDSVINEPDVT